MIPMSGRIPRVFLSLSLALAALPAAAHETLCERPSRLRYSMVPEGDVEKDLARFRPLLDRLGASLGVPVEMLAPASYGAVIEMLHAGKIDVARLGPAVYLSAKKDDPGITAFATASLHSGPYQEQGPYYHSLLVVRADSRFHGTDALRGARLALVDPNSTSGSLIPRKSFPLDAGVTLDSYFSRIAYAGSHLSAARMVLEGRADAAFVSSLQLSTLAGMGELKHRPVRVLWRSAPVPMDPYVYRGGLCKDVQDKIRAAFLDRASDNAAVLGSISALRFVPVSDSDYKVLRDLQ